MKIFGTLIAILSTVGASLRSGLAFIRHKTKSAEDGFHVRRDGRIIYHGRLGPEKFSKFGWGFRPRLAPLGCPKMTGARLIKTLKSCDSSNLIVNPRYLREEKYSVAGAA